MAACHIRSISLPSRSHPLTVSVEEQLQRVRESQSTSFCSSSSICHKLGDLKELYERADDLLQLPLTHQSLSHEQHSELVEDVLDGSLRLLDVCGTTKDVFSQMKGCMRQLESSLRRRSSVDNLASEVEAYMAIRKVLNKVICKSFKNLKTIEKNSTSVLLNKDSNLVTTISMLREVEEISLAVFESLLSFISQAKTRSRPSGWSIVSKLLHSKHASCEQVNTNEVDKIDAKLLFLKSSKDMNVVQAQNVLKGLEALELSIQEAEEELGCVFRLLVKTRVSLLNILNH